MFEVFVVAKWLLVFAALAVIGAPLAAVVFRQFPRRGAAFAIPAALLPTVLLVFWIGQATFGFRTVFASLLVVVAASGVALHRGVEPDWRGVAGSYVVFALGFLFLTAFRAYNAGITPVGGEQFLHFGLVKSLLRAGSLPPEDFWFAGEPLRYYYGTQLQVAMMAKLTDTPARYAFNLGIPAFYAMLVVAAYGLVGTVTSLRDRSYRLGGAFGVFFVAIAGALTTFVRLVFGALPIDVAVEYGQPAFGFVARRFYVGDDGIETMDQAMRAAVREGGHMESWGWWFTRYVVPGTLQEFPLYSFIKSDLHGHALANGYILVAAALALAYYLTPAEHRIRRLGIVYGGIGLIAGVFGFMNTWSLPTAVGLAWLAMAAADAHPATLLPDELGERLRFEPTAESDDSPPDDVAADTAPGAALGRRLAAETWRVVLAGVFAALVGVVGVALASPFLIFGHVPTNNGIGLLPPRTGLAPFLVIYGGIMALFAGFVVYRSWPEIRALPTWASAGGAVALLAVGAVLVHVVDFAVFAVVGPILLGMWWLVRTDRVGFEGVLVVAGVGLLLSFEVVHARVAPYNLPRWNTTLKVAVQGWTLAAAGAGGITALVLSEAFDVLASESPTDTDAPETAGVDAGPHTHVDTTTATDGGSRARSSLATLGIAVLAIGVVLTSTPFVALAFSDEVKTPYDDDAPATIDGLATHERWKAEEIEAIHWLDDRDGRPVIVEPVDTPVPDEPEHIYVEYDWIAPAATLTGLPTVLGWDHQVNYRGGEAYLHRMEQVDDIYTGTWANATSALREHDVQYIYVGPRANELYGGDIRQFHHHDGISVAFENDAVTIYAVDHDELAGDDDEWPANGSARWNGTGANATVAV
jgi:YYY domain-containing protein